MMSSRGELASKEIDAYAHQVGIDVARMRRDMKSPEILDLLQSNHDIAAESKIEGTPGFVINGKFFFGYDPEALDKALRDAGGAPAPT
jgi:2-hydroxychromene-2-carboxylate isomerase